MIFSRYLPEPVLPHPSGSAQEDSPTRSTSSRLGDPGRGFEPFPAARQFSPKHLRWDKGYARPRGGRHLAKYLEKP